MVFVILEATTTCKIYIYFFCYIKMHLVKAICSTYDFYIAIVKVCAGKFLG